MFGKGVYFADMVSKSAGYCFAKQSDPHGLMLLSEVALGAMYEKTGAQMITKLPRGKHSTKGLGRVHPDPESNRQLSDGTLVPLGKPVPTNIADTSLEYNEYIVYDTAQVQMKYLVKMKFDYGK